MDSVDALTGRILGVSDRVRPRRAAKSDPLPDGPSLPPTVQLLAFLFMQYRALDAYRKRYGAPFTLRFPGFVPLVNYDDPEVIKEIFTGSTDVLHAGRANDPLLPIVGTQSLLLLDADRHLQERKLLLPPFHGARMHRYGDIMREITERDVEGWPTGEVFPIHPRTQSITLDVILRTVFGLEEGPKMDALRVAITDLIACFSRPGLTVRHLQLPSFPPWRRFLRSREHTHGLILRMIADRRAAPGGDDVLSLLLEARREDGAEMSNGELLDELLTLLVAGHETTATALAWAFHYLSDSSAPLRGDLPDAQSRAHEELDRVFPDGRVDPERISELEYLDAVVKETLRITPVIGGVGRVLSEPQRIGGRDLPANVMVAPSIYLTHHNPKVFAEPHRFLPERFIGRRLSPYEFFPFGGGVRRCIGMAFAMYEMKVVLATVLMRRQVRRAPGVAIRAVRRSVTMAPSHDMPLIVSRR